MGPSRMSRSESEKRRSSGVGSGSGAMFGDWARGLMVKAGSREKMRTKKKIRFIIPALSLIGTLG